MAHDACRGNSTRAFLISLCIPNIPQLWVKHPLPTPGRHPSWSSPSSTAGEPQRSIQKVGKATNPCGIYSDSRRCRRSGGILSPSSPYPSSPPRDGSARGCLLHGCRELWDGGKPTGMQRETAKGKVLIPVPRCPSSIPGTCRWEQGTTAPSSNQPRTSMHLGAALNSIPAGKLPHPAKKNGTGNATSSPGPGRGGWGWSRSGGVLFPAPNPQGCWFLGEGGGDLEACPFKCCWRLFLGRWLKINMRIPFFFIRKSI